MKILVTGATGFIGRTFCKRAQAEGHSLVVLSRNAQKAKALFPFEVSAYDWDATVGPPRLECLVGVDTVVHLAGEGLADRAWSSARKKELQDSRILGTAHLVKALSQCETLTYFLSASAIGIYGDRKDEWLDEDSSLGTDSLSELCKEWESEARKAPARFRTTVLRMGPVLGLEGGALAKLVPIFKRGIGGRVGSGEQWISWIHEQDLIELILFLLKRTEGPDTVHAVAPEPATNAQFSKTIAECLHRPALLPIPAFAARLAMGEMATVVLNSQRATPKKALEMGFKFKFENLEAALRDLIRNG